MKYLQPLLIIGCLVIVTVIATTPHIGIQKKSSDDITPDDSNSVRVMTFNIRFDNPDDGLDAWPHRSEMVARTMRFHKADIVGVQEALLHQLEALDELLPYFGRIGEGRNAGEDGGEFSALFYRKDRFEMLDNGTFWLSDMPDIAGSVGWDAMLPRIVTWGEFTDKATGRSFFVFNTHFDHIGEKARMESASLILEKIDEIAGDSPVVLTGDFNTTENDPPYKILTNKTENRVAAELSDAFYESEYGHHGPTTTWNGFKEIVPDRRIDFIFTNAGFDVKQHAILADQQDGRFPSDHLPVVADIRFSE